MNRGASVYTGEWERGIRHGYGVLDDITTGEKYMGMWMAGVRHGAGCVVNGDGIYYEGKFVSNKLTGGGTDLLPFSKTVRIPTDKSVWGKMHDSPSSVAAVAVLAVFNGAMEREQEGAHQFLTTSIEDSRLDP